MLFQFRKIASISLMIIPIAANAASGLIVGVPGWAVGAAVLAAIAWGVIKLIFSAGESIVDSVQESSAIDKDQENFKKRLADARAKSIAKLEPLILLDELINDEKDLLVKIKKIISDNYAIEIYDDSHLIGKSTKRLVDELEGQIKKYHFAGGLIYV